MPTNHLCIQSTNATITRQVPDSPPQDERRRDSGGNKDASWDGLYQRAARIMEADRQRTAELSRPPHRCPTGNVIPNHAIQTVASYLAPGDRMSLRHVAWHLWHALQADAAIDRLTMKIAKVVTPSLLRRALAEIDRYPAARPSLIALLLERIQHFCPPHCERALELILDAIQDLPADQRVVLLEKTGPLLRERKFDHDDHWRQQPSMQNLVVEAAQRLPHDIRARPLAAVISSHCPRPRERAATARKLVAGLHAYPPGGRAAMLTALIGQYDTGSRDQDLWHEMLESALQLPVECQAEPLHALASRHGDPLSATTERWDCMMQISATLPEGSQAAIYRGLACALMSLPSVKGAPGTRRRFDWLNSAIAALGSRYQPAVLEALALYLLRAGLVDQWDGILGRIKSLPGERQLGPLRALTQGLWRADWRERSPRCFPTLMEAARDLAADDRAVLLGDLARGAGSDNELNDLFDACLDLPLGLRRWTLAGLASKFHWVLEDNANPVQQILLPMIAGMDASHRVPVFTALLRTAFDCSASDPANVPTRYMPTATWLALERGFHELPPELKEPVLLEMARSISNHMTPAWNWVLRATRQLPAANQPEVLWHLAAAGYLANFASDIRPARMVASAVAALPRHFRAMPLWAAQRVRNNTDDDLLNPVRYLQCSWTIFWQQHSLPVADKF